MLNSSVFFHNIQLYSDHPTLELAAFGLMLCLGLRIHEVANIRYQDINVENRTISVFGKNEKSAILPLPDPLQNYFQKLVVNKGQDVHLFGNNSQSTIRKLRAQYKLYSFVSGWKYPGGPHLLRHTFISRLSERTDSRHNCLCTWQGMIGQKLLHDTSTGAPIN